MGNIMRFARAAVTGEKAALLGLPSPDGGIR
jgi:hypothetical protein